MLMAAVADCNRKHTQDLSGEGVEYEGPVFLCLFAWIVSVFISWLRDKETAFTTIPAKMLLEIIEKDN